MKVFPRVLFVAVLFSTFDYGYTVGFGFAAKRKKPDPCTRLRNAAEDWKAWGKQWADILKARRQDEKQTGAVSPSSPPLVNEILRYLSSTKPLNILELGAGSGVVTRKVIQKKKPKDRFDAIEIDEGLFETLQKSVLELEDRGCRMDNVHLHHFDFTKWNCPKGITYDLIVCTFPFTTLPPDIVQAILDKISQLLKPGGIFTYISYVGAREAVKLKAFFKDDEEELDAFKIIMQIFDAWKDEHFTRLKRSIVPINAPPSFVFHLQRNEE